ncbi:MAG TPA: hypothetical protein VK034_29595, partial [Enhygromyxa sp.]|nr:hypothetical protein [Enhygromyxa sp.]
MATSSMNVARRAVLFSSSLPAARSVLERRMRDALNPATEQRVTKLLRDFERYITGETLAQLRGVSPTDIEARARSLAEKSFRTWSGMLDTTVALLENTGVGDSEIIEEVRKAVRLAAKQPS